MVRAFSDLTGEELRTVIADLAYAAAAQLTEEGVARDAQTATYQVDLRYHGQGFEIPVDLAPEALGGGGDLLETLGATFDAEHKRLFSFLLPNEREVINLRVTVSGPRPQVAFTELEQGSEDPSAALLRESQVWMDGGHTSAGIYDRTTLQAGNVVRGPAIVTEMDSTTLVLSGHAATVDPSGCLVIRPL